MECSEARERLLEYREGQLDLDARMHMEAHLLTCAGCRDELEGMDALLQSVAALPVPDPSPGFARRLHARINAEKRRPRFTWFQASRVLPAWAPAVAALVLVVGTALWAIRSGTLESVESIESVESVESVESPEIGSKNSNHSEGKGRDLLQSRPGRSRDWAALAEGGDRLLVSLAVGNSEMGLEEAIRVWTAIGPGGRATAVFAELQEVSEEELEQFLARLGEA